MWWWGFKKNEYPQPCGAWSEGSSRLGCSDSQGWNTPWRISNCNFRWVFHNKFLHLPFQDCDQYTCVQNCFLFLRHGMILGCWGGLWLSSWSHIHDSGLCWGNHRGTFVLQVRNKHHLCPLFFIVNMKPSQDGRPYGMCTSHFRPWEDWISRHPQCFLAKPWLHS